MTIAGVGQELIKVLRFCHLINRSGGKVHANARYDTRGRKRQKKKVLRPLSAMRAFVSDFANDGFPWGVVPPRCNVACRRFAKEIKLPLSTTTDARIYILSPEFLKNNPDLEHERKLLVAGMLDVAQVAHPFGTQADIRAVVQLRAPTAPLELGLVDARDAKVWYRAMPRSEYLYLKRFGKVQQDASYGAIASNAVCGLGYMGYMGYKSLNTHLVEFDLRCFDKTLYQQLHDAMQSLRQAVQEPHAEGTGDTFGLSMGGHYGGQAGKLFNELLLQGRWRLQYVYMALK
jgi:hypothetical protein